MEATQEYKYPKSIQTLVGLLRRHKIRISTSSPTRIRGWHDHTSGVTVQKKWDGTFIVSHYRAENGLQKAHEAMKSEGYHLIQENLPHGFSVANQKP